MKRQVIFLGDQGSGKTSILNKMTNNPSLSNNCQPTIGVDVQFLVHNEYKYRLIDLSGQERFKFMLSDFLAHTDLVVLVGDASNIESIRHLDHWRDLVTAVKMYIPIITVMNKCDLVQSNELKKIIDTFSFDKQPLTQVSAKNGDNILSIRDLIEKTLHLKNKEPSFYSFFSFDSWRYNSIGLDDDSAQSTDNCIVM